MKKCSYYTFFATKNENILQKLQRYSIVFKFIKSPTHIFISLNSSFNNSIMIENISYLKILFSHNLFLNLTCIIINQFQILPYQNPSLFENNNNYTQVQVQNPALHHENYFFSYFYQLPAMQQNQACIFFYAFCQFFPISKPCSVNILSHYSKFHFLFPILFILICISNYPID